jgi:hypothetical protein
MTTTLSSVRPKANGATPPQRLRPIPWSALHTLPKREPLIRGVLDRGAMSCPYGGSNTGKTFFALDIAAHIALGWETWRGRKVRQGAVVYIAAEGGLGIEERLTAFRYHHEINADGVPFYVIPEPIDLCSRPDDAKLLMAHIAELASDPPIELIVVDTLSRAMAGGNENSPDDMGRFIRNLDALRIATKAHVMVIHHSGKDEARGARGHGSLRAACDTEIEVSKAEGGDVSVATVVKQRDHSIGDTFPFRLEQVEIGQHDDGEPVTSCVVIPTDAQPTTKRKGQPRLTKAAKIALNALKDAVDDHGMPPPPSNRIPPGVRGVSVNRWRQAAYRIGISTGEDRAKQAAFQRGSEALISSQLVRVEGDFAWIT